MATIGFNESTAASTSTPSTILDTLSGSMLKPFMNDQLVSDIELPPWTVDLYHEEEQRLQLINEHDYNYQNPLPDVGVNEDDQSPSDGSVSSLTPTLTSSTTISPMNLLEAASGDLSCIKEEEIDLFPELNLNENDDTADTTAASQHLEPLSTLQVDSTPLRRRSSSSSSGSKRKISPSQRLSHNRIERKYRMNINSKIANLQKLVPWMADGGVAFKVDSKAQRDYQLAKSNGKRLNKSTILDMVTEYMISIKKENEELKMKLQSQSQSQGLY